MRRLLVLLLTVAALVAMCGTAMGHSYLVEATPAAGTSLQASPPVVTLTFSEPVQLLRDTDLDVVDGEGNSVASGPAVRGVDERLVQVPLRPGLPDGTYTVRYSIIGADSHVIPGALVFGVGDGPLGPPFLGGGGDGPTETSVWGTTSRFAEIAALGGLIGLLAFRWLIWAPALRREDGVSADDRTAALTWGRDAFWVGFGVLAVIAMLAEGYLLVVQSAIALGTSVWSALGDAEGISQVLGDTTFGSLVQLRGALLFALFALGAIVFIREYGSSGEPRPPGLTGPPLAGLAMAAILGGVIWGISSQGHARVTDMPWLQVGAQLVHVVAVAVWIVGLAMVALTHHRLPRVAGEGGGILATRVLARFSSVALVAVTVAIVTGVIRTFGEMSDPTELWQTAYGQSVLWKVALLVPIAVLALYSRRILVALRLVPRPTGASLVLVRRMASIELALTLVIVVVASVLVAQVPGGA